MDASPPPRAPNARARLPIVFERSESGGGTTAPKPTRDTPPSSARRRGEWRESDRSGFATPDPSRTSDANGEGFGECSRPEGGSSSDGVVLSPGERDCEGERFASAPSSLPPTAAERPFRRLARSAFPTRFADTIAPTLNPGARAPSPAETFEPGPGPRRFSSPNAREGVPGGYERDREPDGECDEASSFVTSETSATPSAASCAATAGCTPSSWYPPVAACLLRTSAASRSGSGRWLAAENDDARESRLRAISASSSANAAAASAPKPKRLAAALPKPIDDPPVSELAPSSR